MSATFLLGAGFGIFVAGFTWLILRVIGRNRSDVSRDVIVGAISSILAAIAIWFGASIFAQILLPWYQKYAYKGLDLSDRWAIKLGDNGRGSSHLEMTADLKQTTDRVSGVLVVTFKDDRRNPRTYTINGFRREQFMALTFEKMSRKYLGLGTSLVKTSNIGDRLEGYLCAYDSSTGETSCYPCEWNRLNEQD